MKFISLARDITNAFEWRDRDAFDRAMLRLMKLEQDYFKVLQNGQLRPAGDSTPIDGTLDLRKQPD